MIYVCLFKCAKGDWPVQRNNWFIACCLQAISEETPSHPDLPLTYGHNVVSYWFIGSQLDRFCISNELSRSKPPHIFVLSKVRT